MIASASALVLTSYIFVAASGRICDNINADARQRSAGVVLAIELPDVPIVRRTPDKTDNPTDSPSPSPYVTQPSDSTTATYAPETATPEPRATAEIKTAQTSAAPPPSAPVPATTSYSPAAATASVAPATATGTAAVTTPTVTIAAETPASSGISPTADQTSGATDGPDVDPTNEPEIDRTDRPGVKHEEKTQNKHSDFWIIAGSAAIICAAAVITVAVRNRKSGKRKEKNNE